MTITKVTPDDIAGSLLGTLDAVEEHCQNGEHEEPGFMDALYEIVDECSSCGRWCDSGERDDEGRCERCQEDEDEDE